MSSFDDLKAKLAEVFQLHRDDLDFGIYTPYFRDYRFKI